MVHVWVLNDEMCNAACVAICFHLYTVSCIRADLIFDLRSQNWTLYLQISVFFSVSQNIQYTGCVDYNIFVQSSTEKIKIRTFDLE